jgi:hypothetical protein
MEDAETIEYPKPSVTTFIIFHPTKKAAPNMERLLFPLRAVLSEANRGKNTDFLPILAKILQICNF